MTCTFRKPILSLVYKAAAYFVDLDLLIRFFIQGLTGNIFKVFCQKSQKNRVFNSKLQLDGRFSIKCLWAICSICLKVWCGYVRLIYSNVQPLLILNFQTLKKDKNTASSVFELHGAKLISKTKCTYRHVLLINIMLGVQSRCLFV